MNHGIEVGAHMDDDFDSWDSRSLNRRRLFSILMGLTSNQNDAREH